MDQQQVVHNLLDQLDWATLRNLYLHKSIPQQLINLLTVLHILFDEKYDISDPLDQSQINQFRGLDSLILHMRKFQDQRQSAYRLVMAKNYLLKYLLANDGYSDQFQRRLLPVVEQLLDYYFNASTTQGNKIVINPEKIATINTIQENPVSSNQSNQQQKKVQKHQQLEMKVPLGQKKHVLKSPTSQMKSIRQLTKNYRVSNFERGNTKHQHNRSHSSKSASTNKTMSLKGSPKLSSSPKQTPKIAQSDRKSSPNRYQLFLSNRQQKDKSHSSNEIAQNHETHQQHSSFVDQQREEILRQTPGFYQSQKMNYFQVFVDPSLRDEQEYVPIRIGDHFEFRSNIYQNQVHSGATQLSPTPKKSRLPAYLFSKQSFDKKKLSLSPSKKVSEPQQTEIQGTSAQIRIQTETNHKRTFSKPISNISPPPPTPSQAAQILSPQTKFYKGFASIEKEKVKPQEAKKQIETPKKQQEINTRKIQPKQVQQQSQPRSNDALPTQDFGQKMKSSTGQTNTVGKSQKIVVQEPTKVSQKPIKESQHVLKTSIKISEPQPLLKQSIVLSDSSGMKSSSRPTSKQGPTHLEVSRQVANPLDSPSHSKRSQQSDQKMKHSTQELSVPPSLHIQGFRQSVSVMMDEDGNNTFKNIMEKNSEQRNESISHSQSDSSSIRSSDLDSDDEEQQAKVAFKIQVVNEETQQITEQRFTKEEYDLVLKTIESSLLPGQDVSITQDKRTTRLSVRPHAMTLSHRLSATQNKIHATRMSESMHRGDLPLRIDLSPIEHYSTPSPPKHNPNPFNEQPLITINSLSPNEKSYKTGVIDEREEDEDPDSHRGEPPPKIDLFPTLCLPIEAKPTGQKRILSQKMQALRDQLNSILLGVPLPKDLHKEPEDHDLVETMYQRSMVQRKRKSTRVDIVFDPSESRSEARKKSIFQFQQFSSL